MYIVWKRHSCLKMHRFYYLNCLVILGGRGKCSQTTVIKKLRGAWELVSGSLLNIVLLMFLPFSLEVYLGDRCGLS